MTKRISWESESVTVKNKKLSKYFTEKILPILDEIEFNDTEHESEGMWEYVEYEVIMNDGKLVVQDIFKLGRFKLAKMRTYGFEDNRFISTKIINEQNLILRINYKKHRAVAIQCSKKQVMSND